MITSAVESHHCYPMLIPQSAATGCIHPRAQYSHIARRLRVVSVLFDVVITPTLTKAAM